MASSPITSWQVDGETMKTVADFIFLGSEITADGDCSHETKRHLLLGRKVMTNLDSILKSRDITLPTKICLVKAMVFPVVMCGCESWTVKKAECQKIDGFELWCWRRLLRVPWTAGRSNQSIRKEISPGCWSPGWNRSPAQIGCMRQSSMRHLQCWSWNSNTWPPHVKSWLIGKEPEPGRNWGQEEKGTTEDEMAGWCHRLDGHEFE